MYSTSSGTVFTGTPGLVKRKNPNRPTSEIGVKSFTGSYGGAFRDAGTQDMAVLVPKKSVYPSGGDLRTASAAITPSPPGRASTTTGWPSPCPSACDQVLADSSAAPLGGNGTIRRTGFDG